VLADWVEFQMFDRGFVFWILILVVFLLMNVSLSLHLDSIIYRDIKPDK